MEHVCVQVRLTDRVFLCAQVYQMPRNAKGIGRTGKKHKKPASYDIYRQPKNQGAIQSELSTQGLQQGSTAPDKDTVEVMGDNDLGETDRPAASVIQPSQYVLEPHPNYERDEPFLPGYRGHGGALGEEKWDPDEPPCIPSDERPENIFGSSVAARAVAAAEALENVLLQGDPEASDYEEDEGQEEREEVAKVKYKHALRRLAEVFPELHIPDGLHAGLGAGEQESRPCPCGTGLLARWPWVLQTASLGFCPSADWSTDGARDDAATADIQGKHSWEIICWRSEWISAAPDGDRIAW